MLCSCPPRAGERACLQSPHQNPAIDCSRRSPRLISTCCGRIGTGLARPAEGPRKTQPADRCRLFSGYGHCVGGRGATKDMGRGRTDRLRGHDRHLGRAGNDRSPHQIYIQVAGSGQRIAAPKLRQAMKKSETFTDVSRFVQVFMVQTAHTAIANARGRLDARLARWLLMAHDQCRPIRCR